MLGRRPPAYLRNVDCILRQVELLSRGELVWLTTYLSGRLRALPPPRESDARVNPASSPASREEGHACSPVAGAQVSSRTLPECIEEHKDGKHAYTDFDGAYPGIYPTMSWWSDSSTFLWVWLG